MVHTQVWWTEQDFGKRRKEYSQLRDEVAGLAAQLTVTGEYPWVLKDWPGRRTADGDTGPCHTSVPTSDGGAAAGGAVTSAVP